jgi:mRNA-degrading endonuclease toxin of MazEF toxin-antitoxin module
MQSFFTCSYTVHFSYSVLVLTLLPHRFISLTGFPLETREQLILGEVYGRFESSFRHRTRKGAPSRGRANRRLECVHPSTIVCPLTTKTAGFKNPLRVALPKAVAGLSRASDVLVDQIKSIDNRRLRRKLGVLPDPYLS